jgi:putative inorganic carbon (HCO3(-)) transporter
MNSTIGRSTSGLVLGAAGLISMLGLGFALVFMKLSPIVILVLMVGATTVAVSAFRPYLGVHVIVALIFVEGAITATEGVTAMQAFGALLLTGWLAQSLAQRRLGVHVTPTILFAVAYLVWCGLSVMRASNFKEAASRLGTYGLLCITAMMVASVVNTTDKVRRLFTALVLWTVVSALIALLMYYGGMTPVAQGLLKNRNFLALYLNLGLVGAFLLQGVVRSALSRLMLFVSVPVLLLTVSLTLSRTGLIVMLIALALVGYLLLRQRGLLLLVGGALAVCVLALLLPSTFWSRAETILPSITQQQDTFGMRVRLWEAGLRMIEGSPILGVGPGNFRVELARYARGSLAGAQLNAHNAYVVVAAETGIPGLILFLGIVISGILGVRGVARAAHAAGREDLARCSMMVQVLTLVILLTGIAMTVEGLKILWIILGVGQGLVGMARADLLTAAGPERAPALPEHAEAAPL